MLRVARKKNPRPNVTFRQADGAKLPFDDETFDISRISFALHEMPRSIRLYEHEPYATFVRSDLGALLGEVGFEVCHERPALLGVARMLTARKL